MLLRNLFAYICTEKKIFIILLTISIINFIILQKKNYARQ